MNQEIWISHREAAVPLRGITHGSRCGTWWTDPMKRGAARCWIRLRRTAGPPASTGQSHHNRSAHHRPTRSWKLNRGRWERSGRALLRLNERLVRSPGKAIAETMSPDQQPSEGRRGASRSLLPIGISVSLTLASKRSAFVNLRNVSRTGACVVRQGRLDITEDDTVIFEARNYDTGTVIRMRSRVRWLRNTGFNTYVGLSFIDTTLSPKSLFKLFS